MAPSMETRNTYLPSLFFNASPLFIQNPVGYALSTPVYLVTQLSTTLEMWIRPYFEEGVDPTYSSPTETHPAWLQHF